ncbi:MAG: cation:proton antiporter [Phycisphaeraceae bacterium]|nr:cation:proton antiporter [Phycisphaeraceae bacterium]
MLDWLEQLRTTNFPLDEPVLVFATVMLIILLAPLTAQRLRLPGIIGLIIAGIIVGPPTLNMVERDRTIELLGAVGLLYIMFMAGLELDLNQFFKHRNRSLLFGSLSYLIPQLLGLVVALFVLGFPWPAAILLASMFGSHTLLAYPLAKRLGITRNLATISAIGGTMVTDTGALLVLAVVAASHTGELSPMFWLGLAGSLGVYVTGVLWGLPRLGRWFFHNKAQDGAVEFVFVLAAGFSCAYLAKVAGVQPIIGAFLGGLALNRLIPNQGALMNRITFVGNTLFVPLFLLSVGMLVDLRMFLESGTTWFVGGVMVVTVVVTKFLAAQAARWLLGYTPAEGLVIFGLSVPQAAATLAAVFVGYDLGIFGEFGDEVLNGAVMMILATCVLGPWLVERYGRVVAAAEEAADYRPEDAPQRILVPLANPTTADGLMDLAFAVREPNSQEPVYPLSIASDDGHVEAHVAASEKMLGHAVIYAAGAGVPVIPVTRVDLNIANGIARAVTELRVSQIIIGWQGQLTYRSRIFGTVLDQLLDQTRQSILFCRLSGRINTTERLLVLIPPLSHLQPGFETALALVKRLARNIRARPHILAERQSIERIKKPLERARPELAVTFAPIEHWDDLPDTLKNMVREHDMLLLFSARRGQLAWHSRLDRLPRVLANRFPNLDFAALYPSEVVVEGAALSPEMLESRRLTQMLADGRTAFGLDDIESHEAISRIVALRFADQPQAHQRLTEVLVHNSRQFPAEVAPNVVLIHAHVPEVRSPTILLGISQTGLDFPKVNRKANLVFALLNPENHSPDAHLKTLAAIARLLSNEDLTQRLRNAGSAEDLLETIRIDDPAY